MHNIDKLLDFGLFRRPEPRFFCGMCGSQPLMLTIATHPSTQKTTWEAECCNKRGRGEITRESPRIIECIASQGVA